MPLSNVGEAELLFKLSFKINPNSVYMYIKLIRNEPRGNAITGRLVIDGRWFCDTLERKGYEILALCYPIAVTHSPKFNRLLPIVQNVPRSAPAFTEDSADEPKASASGGNLFRRTESESSEPNEIYKISAPPGQGALRTGIRFHRGTKPEHSTGCILVVADNKNKDNLNNLCARPTLALAKLSSLPLSDVGEAEMLSMLSLEKTETLSSKHIPIGCRSAADVEQELTRLILKAQNAHEEIILEVTDFRPGTEYGYNTPCPPELQECVRDARRTER